MLLLCFKRLSSIQRETHLGLLQLIFIVVILRLGWGREADVWVMGEVKAIRGKLCWCTPGLVFGLGVL